MQYYGDVYRPPSEAYSLIVQATLGCSHNSCGFCSMYKAKQFHIRPLQDVLDDLSEYAGYPYQRCFLADGDALIMPQKNLVTILNHIRETNPMCERVSLYASPGSIRRKTPEELKELRDLGLGMAYMGLESGNDDLLKKYTKGYTASEIVEAGCKIKESGIKLSVTAINGMGGTAMSQQHAIDTAKAFSVMKPDYIGMLVLRVHAGTPLEEWIRTGEMDQLSREDLVRENKILLENIDSEGTVFRSNHASNHLVLAGTLNRDREMLIRKCEAALENPVLFRDKRFIEF